MDHSLDALYSARILELSASLEAECRLPPPRRSVTEDNPLCGSRIIVDLRCREGIVMAYGHQVRACVLGRAAAAILHAGILGCDQAALQRPYGMLAALLAGQGAPPESAVWTALRIFEPAQSRPARHGVILLPFAAAVRALSAPDSIEEAEEEA